MIIDYNHSLWTTIDDDDWNGATAGNYLANVVAGEHITLIVPEVVDDGVLGRIVKALLRVGGSVNIVNVEPMRELVMMPDDTDE